MPGSFLVTDLNVRGETELREVYHYDHLQKIPGAAELIVRCATQIWRSPQEFEAKLPGDRLNLRWSATARSCGVMTIRDGQSNVVSVSIVVAGLEPEADQLTLQAFQRHLLAELRDTPYEPAFDLLEIPERPLVATINIRTPESESDQVNAALADRCFGAAFFRYLSLA
jgi:hypothetical protein